MEHTVDANTSIVIVGQQTGFEASHVAALGEVLVETEVGHEFVDDAGRVLHGPVFVGGDAGAECVAG
jgi:fructoselysine-6-P-deglycase FrlB-like protein